MKKILVIAVCLLMVLSLLACNSESDKNHENESDSAQSSEKEPTPEQIALEMFQAAVNGTIRIHNEFQGEIELKDCLLPGMGKRMEKCIVNESIVIDLDDDGISEYVIKSSLGDSVILRYFDGKVYAYTMSFRNFYNLHTDGSFYWNQTKEGKLSYGASKIRFVAEELTIVPVLSVVNDGEEDAAYYIGEKAVTEQELLDYIEQTNKSVVEYTDFDAPWKKNISEERAIEIAEKHWKIKNGDVDPENGYTYALIPQYSESGNYLIALAWLVENHHYSTIDVIEIDAFTGKIITQE